ncbi:ribonuclease HI family protein [Crocosphaera sp. UHCC 0190]|uniref:ribonuclease HI family protein n=1 Tax=Crocosphaera sp. UHCC 0190 TaxID=3110246 RepID=UPI002B20E0F2|nr:ribonuclease HI family protein [Crocosphaera sp. UHCC 0190]MEA5509875.1 ribonuclease HI family protein [Crocosphaera sp. UHCC 0190]
MSSYTNQPIIAKDTPIMLFDGASQGNSGQGAAAAILLMPNGRRYTVSQLISVTSKEEAEYTGLIIGLKKAQKLGLSGLEIKGDSDLVFNQVNGLTPVTEERLIRLYRTAIKLMRSFEKISLEWISPDQNRPAKSAVKRCIGEALGREKPEHQGSVSQSFSLAIAHLIQQGNQATEEDYRQLTTEPDEWTQKSLSELRALIPLEVRDAIALQWQGDEENLAQMYRWHLRGLPPLMACRKVNLEQTFDPRAVEKLPWEEALNLPPHLSVEPETSSEPLISLLSELDNVVEKPPESSSPPEVEPNVFETFKLSDIDSPEASDGEIPGLDQSESLGESLFHEENMTLVIDVNQDTLPSESSLTEILKMIGNLSPEEKITLAQELVKFPEMVNLILKTIADNVSKGNTLP